MTSLLLSDVMCSICLNIIIEPVTLPCKHELCKACFEQNVRKGNFECPICRIRISSWSRRAYWENCLVNQQRWKEIREAFPDEILDRLRGIENVSLSEPPPCLNTISEPGEIRQEFELLLKRFHEEEARARELEIRANEEFIRKLNEEELQTTACYQIIDEIIATDLHCEMNIAIHDSEHDNQKMVQLPPVRNTNESDAYKIPKRENTLASKTKRNEPRYEPSKAAEQKKNRHAPETCHFRSGSARTIAPKTLSDDSIQALKVNLTCIPPESSHVQRIRQKGMDNGSKENYPCSTHSSCIIERKNYTCTEGRVLKRRMKGIVHEICHRKPGTSLPRIDHDNAKQCQKLPLFNTRKADENVRNLQETKDKKLPLKRHKEFKSLTGKRSSGSEYLLQRRPKRGQANPCKCDIKASGREICHHQKSRTLPFNNAKQCRKSQLLNTSKANGDLRNLQEMEDRKLALKLHKELNVRRLSINRSKGSGNEYLLRRRPPPE